MSQKIRIGNHYWHTERDSEVIVTHRDETDSVWFRGVKSKDNAGVIATSEWIDQQPYADFLGDVQMEDYPREDEWQALREAVLERDNHRCQGCGTDDAELHAHHIVPLGCGGTNTLRNLITLCQQCHGRVHGGSI